MLRDFTQAAERVRLGRHTYSSNYTTAATTSTTAVTAANATATAALSAVSMAPLSGAVSAAGAAAAGAGAAVGASPYDASAAGSLLSEFFQNTVAPYLRARLRSGGEQRNECQMVQTISHFGSLWDYLRYIACTFFNNCLCLHL